MLCIKGQGMIYVTALKFWISLRRGHVVAFFVDIDIQSLLSVCVCASCYACVFVCACVLMHMCA
jgi:hypothetical protein